METPSLPEQLARPHILGLKPYTSARDEFSGEAHVFLDANENSYGPVIGGEWHRYPDPLQHAVKEKLAAIKGVSPEQIFLGNGSDEAIDLLYRVYCQPGQDKVLLLPPTYGMYQVSADIHGVETISVPLTETFQPDLPAVLAAMAEHKPKLVFLCTPNNPSGNCFDPTVLRAIVDAAPGLVVVDEAYIDFAPDQSVMGWLSAYPQLVIMQTFSKAWGLAALRLGMAFAHPSLIRLLNKVKAPYNVNALTQEKALEALALEAEKNRVVDDIVTGRLRLSEQLAQHPLVLRVYPSDANFLLVKVVDAEGIYREMINMGIILRNRSKVILCEDCLRITVGTPQENLVLVEALDQLIPMFEAYS
ncbi:MAG: histidinol-phosphate transaminase [Bacteroidia bacterium]|nr:histidinol-phosphate transaminase [Bacteroidia bacterium]